MLANDDLDRVGRGDEQLSKKLRKRAAIYVRVSSAAQEDNY
jgi:predicted site-specific integrase-resolvase